jgi:hypothetical protein
MKRVDLDDMSGCPNHGPCAVCGTEEDVVTSTFETRWAGVFCLRVCTDCLDTGADVRLDVPGLYERICEHCEHLGISGDEMAALYNKEFEL